MYGSNKYMIDINIETLAGTTFSLKVSKLESVQSIKAKIQRHEGIPISHQHLVWQSNELDDKCSLNDYNVPNGATIRMVLTLRGGPINTRRMTTEDTFIRDVSDLMEIQEDSNLWNNDSAAAHSINKHVTLLLFKDGDRYNFLRIIDRADAASPTSGAMSAASMYVPFDENETDTATAATTTAAASTSAAASSAAAAAAAAATLEEGITDLINKSARLSKLISTRSSASRRRKSSSQQQAGASKNAISAIENKKTRDKMNAIKKQLKEKSKQQPEMTTAQTLVETAQEQLKMEPSNTNSTIGVVVNDAQNQHPSISQKQAYSNSAYQYDMQNSGQRFSEAYYDDDDDEEDDDDDEDEDDDDEDEEDEEEDDEEDYTEVDDDDDECVDDEVASDDVDDEDEYDDEDDYEDEESDQENTDEEDLDPEKYYERQLSVNPPSTADATITGALGDDDQQQASLSGQHMQRQQSSNEAADAAANEELLLNKSEFLLNELTGGMVGGDSQSPLTSADLMAIMMMTMSAADQISLNGVSSSLATTALPTVLTPLYTTDNEQYVVRRRRRRQRNKGSEANPTATALDESTSTNNKKYIRIRRKVGAAARKKANKSTTTTTPACLEPSATLDTQPTLQEQSDSNKTESSPQANDADNTTQLEAKVAAKQAKPKHRKRKRILNLVAANEIISTNNQMTQTSDQQQEDKAATTQEENNNSKEIDQEAVNKSENNNDRKNSSSSGQNRHPNVNYPRSSGSGISNRNAQIAAAAQFASPAAILLKTISLENTRKIIKESNERRLKRLESLENSLIKRLAEVKAVASASSANVEETTQNSGDVAANTTNNPDQQTTKDKENNSAMNHHRVTSSSYQQKRVSFTVNETTSGSNGLNDTSSNDKPNNETNRRSSAQHQPPQLRPLILTNYRQKPPPKLDSLYTNNTNISSLNDQQSSSLNQSTELDPTSRAGLLSARRRRAAELILENQLASSSNKLDTLKNHIGTPSILRPYQQISLNHHHNHASTSSRSNLDQANEIVGTSQQPQQQHQRIEISRIANNSGSNHHPHHPHFQSQASRTSSSSIITRQLSISSQDLDLTPPSSHPHLTSHHTHHQAAATATTTLKLPPVVTAINSSATNTSSSLLIGGSANNINSIGLSDSLTVTNKKKTGNDLGRYCNFCKKKTGLASSYTCRCGNNYCTQHRNAEAHMCTYDYKTEGRKLIEQSNPLVAAPKLPKI